MKSAAYPSESEPENVAPAPSVGCATPAQNAAQGQDVPTNCPFCGAEDREDWQAELLHDAHGQIEELALADPGSEEFDRLLASVAAFVGVERV